MSRTVDQIGDQLTPKRLFNALLDKADQSGVDTNYLIEGARRNPMALGLIAAGAIWLVSDKDSKFPTMPKGKAKNGGAAFEDDGSEHDVHHRDYVSHMSSRTSAPYVAASTFAAGTRCSARMPLLRRLERRSGPVPRIRFEEQVRDMVLRRRSGQDEEAGGLSGAVTGADQMEGFAFKDGKRFADAAVARHRPDERRFPPSLAMGYLNARTRGGGGLNRSPRPSAHRARSRRPGNRDGSAPHRSPADRWPPAYPATRPPARPAARPSSPDNDSCAFPSPRT